jgi:MinD-like ATPase involved in chromosome partitioning or flagellar assembly
MAPDIALAASAREWPDRLHRFVLDHGGGRIVDRIMSPDQAMEAAFDILLIDDVCSFLTPHLVTVIKQSGGDVLGVFAPEDGSDAKRRLLESGISDVIETGASPEEFLEKILQTLAHRTHVDPDEVHTFATLSIAVTGPSEGVGMTEVAISLASLLSERIGTALVDLDPVWPSVAQRLNLGVHPNIRTAIDHALHSSDRLEDAMHQLGPLNVVGGRADGVQGSPISRHEVLALIEGLASYVEVVVADLGPLRQVDNGLTREFDSIIVVGAGDPVGVARLIKTAADLKAAQPHQSILAIVNMLGRSRFEKAEVVSEIAESCPDLPTLTLPFDHRLDAAAWDGKLPVGGRAFARAGDAMCDVVVRSLQ